MQKERINSYDIEKHTKISFHIRGTGRHNKYMGKENQVPKKIDIHYIKSKDLSTIHVDGIIGGITPKGKLYFEPYLERLPIPQITIHQLDDNKVLSEPIDSVGKNGVVRYIEKGLIMDIETAKTIKDWLGKKIQEFEEIQKTTPNE